MGNTQTRPASSVRQSARLLIVWSSVQSRRRVFLLDDFDCEDLTPASGHPSKKELPGSPSASAEAELLMVHLAFVRKVSGTLSVLTTLLSIQWCLAFPLSRGFSLAGDFLIRLDHDGGQAEQTVVLQTHEEREISSSSRHHSCIFSLIPLDNTDPFTARQCLQDHPYEQSSSEEGKYQPTTINASFSERNLCVKIIISSNDVAFSPLIQVLAKVLAHHWFISFKTEVDIDFSQVYIHLPDASTIDLKGIQCLDKEVPLRLFDGGDEMVEMVCQDGTIIGAVPRALVHQYNLLHRGIGLFVTKGFPIRLVHGGEQPDVYIHRRTSTKRIFPSLYDMFVGGVSGLYEAPIETARREVEEELGLERYDALSGPFLQCIICTCYNRCVVDLFCYTADPEEKIYWQDEEVSWGDYVPYDVVEAAADRSIQRCDPWPGSLNRYQSSRRGRLNGCEDYANNEWKHWDFVPDGLLVWEAWARWLKHKAQTGD